MDYSVIFACTLLALGLALIVAELFIPSGGVITMLSAVCIGASIYCAYDAWWEKNPNGFWWFITSIVGLIPLTAGATLFVLSRTRLGKRVFLEGPKLEEVTPYSHEAEQRKQLVGKTGKTVTLMAPGGLVLVEGQRWHAETEGQMLDPDQPIKIVEVRGNRVMVQPYEPARSQRAPEAESLNNLAETETPAEESSQAKRKESRPDSKEVPLDFEIPES